jgi:hypothetical protein
MAERENIRKAVQGEGWMGRGGFGPRMKKNGAVVEMGKE